MYMTLPNFIKLFLTTPTLLKCQTYMVGRTVFDMSDNREYLKHMYQYDLFNMHDFTKYFVYTYWITIKAGQLHETKL